MVKHTFLPGVAWYETGLDNWFDLQETEVTQYILSMLATSTDP